MFLYILYALLAWFIYKFIVGFVIPVYRTTRDVKNKFREMHQQMQGSANPQQRSQQKPQQHAEAKKPAGDYIDFEEVD